MLEKEISNLEIGIKEIQSGYTLLEQKKRRKIILRETIARKLLKKIQQALIDSGKAVKVKDKGLKIHLFNEAFIQNFFDVNI